MTIKDVSAMNREIGVIQGVALGLGSNNAACAILDAAEVLGEMVDKLMQEVVVDEPAAAVDVVEVVRCKECRYRKTERCQMYWESEDGREQYNWETDDDFCSSGKRVCNDGKIE